MTAWRLEPERSPFPRLLAFPVLTLAAMFAVLARVDADLLRRSARCALRDGVGLPCPTCGGTQAAIDLAWGRPLAALAANPLVATILLAGALWCLYAVAATFVPRWRRSLALERRGMVAFRWTALVLVAGNWAWEVWGR
ncbi:MAG: DUF2752 domain-containing protein [bacterium]|nr:DUF2752 domain-containing protein [bacterium]